MNYQPESEVVITERANYKKLFKAVFFILAIVGLVYGAYFYYMNYYRYRNIPTPEAVSDTYGLENTGTTEVSGSLYYAVNTKETADNVSMPFVFRYDAAEKYSGLKSQQGLKSYVALSPTTAIVIATNDPNDNSQTWQPHLYDATKESLTELPNEKGYFVRDLAVSADGLRYAYSYRVDDASESSMTDISSWKIAIRTIGSPDEVEIIDAATEPEWLRGSDTLVYMTADGLYTYVVGFKESTLLTDKYAPFDLSSDYAVTPADNKIIITSEQPLLNTMAVLQIGTDESGTEEVKEIGRVSSDSVRYSNPVFAADGVAYAVLATTMSASGDGNAGPKTAAVEKQVIEIRGVGDKDAVGNVELPADITSDVSLSSWSAE